MNPDLQLLQPYPFQKLAKLFGEVIPNAALKPISLHIGEPKHATPQFIKDALVAGLDGLAKYPTTTGSDELRTTIANWQRQYCSAIPTQPPMPTSYVPSPTPDFFAWSLPPAFGPAWMESASRNSPGSSRCWTARSSQWRAWSASAIIWMATPRLTPGAANLSTPA